MNSLLSLRVLGLYPLNRDDLAAALECARSCPTECASIVPDLCHGAWLPADHWWIANFELAAVRWLEVERASRWCRPLADQSQPSGESIAALVRKSGCSALSFMKGEGLPTRDQITALGDFLALELAQMLQGRIYVLPLPGWTAEMARAIEADITAELAASDSAWLGSGALEEWQPCPERSQLLDQAEALAATFAGESSPRPSRERC